jgi:hypothetical protein
MKFIGRRKDLVRKISYGSYHQGKTLSTKEGIG